MMLMCVVGRFSIDGVPMAERQQLRDKYPLCLYRICNWIQAVIVCT